VVLQSRSILQSDRVQQSLSSQGELIQPGEELAGRGIVGEYAHDLGRRPPLLREEPGRRHIEWLSALLVRICPVQVLRIPRRGRVHPGLHQERAP
jgi:hypothetical protein